MLFSGIAPRITGSHRFSRAGVGGIARLALTAVAEAGAPLAARAFASPASAAAR